jgi:hypothetical protein
MSYMKTKYFALLGLFVIFLTACDMSNSSNYTPQISILTSHINKTDTLNLYYTDQGGILRLDTINVGDTIVFRMDLNGITNNLTAFNFTTTDTTTAKVIFPVKLSMDSLFVKEQSDYVNGKFVFQPKKVRVYFPVRYVAKKATITSTIQISLSSDAVLNGNLQSNQVSMTVKTPIKEKKVIN